MMKDKQSVATDKERNMKFSIIIPAYNEENCSEDVDFELRLKKWGQECGKKYGTITKAQMIVSLRKADVFGN